jgi:hypothetical protein
MINSSTTPVRMSYVNEVRNSCGFDLSRPLVIAGNGPSILQLDYRQIPENAYVFRCNWFFQEDHYRLGRRVDGYFWSIHNEGMMRALEAASRIGGYRIGAYFSPVAFEEFADSSTMCSKQSFLPLHNHWRIIAGQPDLAASMMMRPLPTQGMQMLATALELGFRDIYLVGIDFYQDPNSRYAFEIPESLAGQWLLPKDLKPGYESNHDIAVDLKMLEFCLSSYPDLKISNLGRDNPLLLRSNVFHRESGEILFEGMENAELSTITESKRPLYKKILVDGEANELRCAYVTYADEKFLHGVAALANSLSKVTDVPLVVMVPPGTNTGMLPELENIRLYYVDKIANPNERRGKDGRFSDTYSKLNVFRLPFLDRAVFLDADTLVLKKCDHLFNRNRFAAAPDFGFEHNHETFNSGVFVCMPSIDVFNRMMGQISKLPSYDGGDQGFLNLFFEEYDHLDRGYNTLKRVASSFNEMFDLEAVYILHFVGEKPWQAFESYHEKKYKNLNTLWFSYLPDQSKIALLHEFRSMVSKVGSLGLVVDLKHFEVNGLVPESISEIGPVKLKPIDMANVMINLGRYDVAKAISEACLQKNPGSKSHQTILETCKKRALG